MYLCVHVYVWIAAHYTALCIFVSIKFNNKSIKVVHYLLARLQNILSSLFPRAGGGWCVILICHVIIIFSYP